jgi:propanol-preferring alcohol dehydrogenase
MRAAVLHRVAPVDRRPLSIDEREEPTPGPGEIRLLVRACGVCRTDLHVVEGDLESRKLPLVPGHEVVGTVDAIGADVRGFSIGDRVGIAWVRSTCGKCEFCLEGRTNLCEKARFTGWTDDGGYAEHAVVPAAWAYPIPDVFSDDEAAPLLCAGIIGYRALGLSNVKPGERLGLYGFGGSAHIVIQIAIARGCEVFVASIREEHQKLAREMGASWVGGADAMPPVPLHGSILFAPAGEIVPPALRALRAGGTLACAGIHMSPIPKIDYDRDLFRERVLRSVTANTRADGLALLREAAEIRLKPRTEPFPLAEANRALALLKEGKIRGAAVLHP